MVDILLLNAVGCMRSPSITYVYILTTLFYLTYSISLGISFFLSPTDVLLWYSARWHIVSLSNLRTST